jgi:WD40 repeat protein
LAAGHGGTICVWNWDNGDLELIIKDGVDASLGYVMCAALSRTNQLLVVGAMYGAFVFATNPVRLISQFEQHRGQVNAISLSPDESFVVSASADETVRQWATESGRQIKGFHQEDLDKKDPSGNYANAVALSSDGTRVLSGGSSTLTWLWNIKNNDQPLHVLRGHQSPIWTTVLASDGFWAATGSRTETICWNLIDGKPVRVLDKCTLPVLLPDEEHLLVTSPDGPSLLRVHFESQGQSMLFKV